jgi:hypothetical protein
MERREMSPIEKVTGKPPKEAWGGFRAEVIGEPELPISGGWGYTLEDACVIEVEDSWEGISLEKEFAKRRIMEEMIVRREPDESFMGIEWWQEMQSLHGSDGRFYDRLEFTVSGIPRQDWLRLKEEYEGPQGVASEGFDRKAHQARRQACTVRVQREFWFDITNFYGK